MFVFFSKAKYAIPVHQNVQNNDKILLRTHMKVRYWGKKQPVLSSIL